MPQGVVAIDRRVGASNAECLDVQPQLVQALSKELFGDAHADGGLLVGPTVATPVGELRGLEIQEIATPWQWHGENLDAVRCWTQKLGAKDSQSSRAMDFQGDIAELSRQAELMDREAMELGAERIEAEAQLAEATLLLEQTRALLPEKQRRLAELSKEQELQENQYMALVKASAKLIRVTSLV
uniref:Uncharacterized protein n=1 Tax=Zooxanthella nutricula TaxID=1333877 RepID=A0A7S2QC09_9DINO